MQPTDRADIKPAKAPYPLWRRLLKILLWTLMAVVLAVYGILATTVDLLRPERLTPLVVNIANRALDAKVDMARVELSTMMTYPFLKVEIDSLEVLSPRITALKSDSTRRLPAYADTLLTLDRFIGELNLPSLAMGELQIHNVCLIRPAVNIVVVDEAVNNFNIFPETDTTAVVADKSEAPLDLPPIVIRRFAVEQPGPLRYYDQANNTETLIDFRAIKLEGADAPLYNFDFGGRLVSPLLGRFNLRDFPFSLNGDIRWDARKPYAVRLSDFDVELSFIKGRFNADFDFERDLRVNSFDTQLEAVSFEQLLATVPDSLIVAYGLRGLTTDGSVSVSLRLDSVYNTALQRIPYATAEITVPACKVSLGRMRLDKFALDIVAGLRGDDIDAATVDIRQLNVAGPATDVKLSGLVSRLMSDPSFDGRVLGYTNISKLPPQVANLVNGSISGRLTASLDVRLSQSMLDLNNFHRIALRGDLDADRVSYLADDTLEMAYINHACLRFGSNMLLKPGAYKHRGDSLLAVSITTDSTAIMHSDLSMKLIGAKLGLGAKGLLTARDTLNVVPMGGIIKVDKFGLSVLTDSAGVRLRNLEGSVAIKRFKNLKRVPQFIFDLGVGSISAGSKSTRLLIRGSKLHFSANKNPEARRQRLPRRLRAAVDSIARVHPELPVDSVYAYAIREHRAHRTGYPHVHPEMTDTASEIIDWNTTRGFRRLLLDWQLEGSLKSERAGIFTPVFPLRNRVVNLNVRFNNDSVAFDDIAYKVGHSDFMASGLVSNLRRALTSRGYKSPIKVHFDAVSDTVDVNELADALFKAGARSEAASKTDFAEFERDDDLDREIGRYVADAPDSISPLLIPVNVTADINLRAYNVLYGDMDFHDLLGEILIYDGALSLHRLQADSEAGDVNLSALYSAPDPSNLKFGFGMKVDKFKIERFMDLVPALDSIMPLMRDMTGVINADIAATVDIDKQMNFVLPSLNAAVKLDGDSLCLLDRETFRTISKWLMFKHKDRNIIDSMRVEMVIADNKMQLYPFVFDIDRYRLGVQGHNDLALNFNYKISVLKSPLPFKFGITLKGNPDDYKIRLGRAKFNEREAIERTALTDTTRINLIEQIENVFRRGVRRSRFARLNIAPDANEAADINLDSEPVTAADSAVFIREGLIPAPEVTPADITKDKKSKKSKK